MRAIFICGGDSNSVMRQHQSLVHYVARASLALKIDTITENKMKKKIFFQNSHPFSSSLYLCQCVCVLHIKQICQIQQKFTVNSFTTRFISDSFHSHCICVKQIVRLFHLIYLWENFFYFTFAIMANFVCINVCLCICLEMCFSSLACTQSMPFCNVCLKMNLK